MYLIRNILQLFRHGPTEFRLHECPKPRRPWSLGSIYAVTTTFWVLLKHLPNLDGLDANTSQEVPDCIYVQHFFLTKGNNKGRSIKPSCVYVPCKII